MYCKPLHPKTPPMLLVPRLGPLGNGVYWGGMMRLLRQATYHPCPTGQRCNTDKPRCANCQGEHNSWTSTCPAAKAAFELQAQKEEYATGKFESYTPFTFADTEYTLGKTYEGCFIVICLYFIRCKNTQYFLYMLRRGVYACVRRWGTCIHLRGT